MTNPFEPRSDLDAGLSEGETIALITRLQTDFEAIGRAIVDDPSPRAALDAAAAIASRRFAVTTADRHVKFSTGPVDDLPRLDPELDLNTFGFVRCGGWWRVEIPSATRREILWMSAGPNATNAEALLVLSCLRQVLLHFDHVQWTSRRTDLALRTRLAQLIVEGASSLVIGRLAARLGIALDASHLVVELRMQPTDLLAEPTSIQPLLDSACVVESDGSLIFISHDVDRFRREFDRIWAQNPYMRRPSGFSSVAADCHDLSAQIIEARVASRYASWKSSPVAIHYEEMSLVDIATSNIDEVLARRLVEERLGLLLAYDAGHASDLITTLRTWLDRNDSLDRVASALHIHRNTLTYRLARIRQHLDVDLNDAFVQHELRLAINLLERDEHRHEPNLVTSG